MATEPFETGNAVLSCRSDWESHFMLTDVKRAAPSDLGIEVNLLAFHLELRSDCKMEKNALAPQQG